MLLLLLHMFSKTSWFLAIIETPFSTNKQSCTIYRSIYQCRFYTVDNSEVGHRLLPPNAFRKTIIKIEKAWKLDEDTILVSRNTGPGWVLPTPTIKCSKSSRFDVLCKSLRREFAVILIPDERPLLETLKLIVSFR